MKSFFKYFKIIYPHFMLIFSFALIVQWILSMFNPTLGLISMHDPVCTVELIVYFTVGFIGSLLLVIESHKKDKIKKDED